MANIYYLKKSAKDCVVKVVGDDSATIPLSSLLTDKQVVAAGDTLRANINEFYWSCDLNTKLIITRNGAEIARFHENGALQFGAGFVDSVENDGDINIEFNGGFGAIWIKLVKHGYANTIEEATYSIYDNPNVAGE